MWSQKELNSIFARTGLAPSSAFLEAAEAMRLDIPSLFEVVVLTTSATRYTFITPTAETLATCR